MAKDPAFLFYPGDWLGGTMLYTRHQKGCYIDLLMAQFNSGPLSLDHIKTVLGQDQATWTVLREKFKVDNNGRFFNEKLATEIEKRKAYTASLRNRGQGRKKSYDYSSEKHMNKHMEDGNENKDELGKGGTGEKPQIEYPFSSVEFRTAWFGWKQYLKESFKSDYRTFSAEQAALKTLSDLSGSDEKKAIHLITYNMGKQYKSFYQDKDYGSQPKHTTETNRNSVKQLGKNALNELLDNSNSPNG